MNRKLLSLGLVAVLGLAGCAPRVKTVTNLPANVTQKQAQDYDTAVANLQKVAAVTTTLRTSLITLNRTLDASGNSVFPDGKAYATALTAVGKIDQFQITAANFLKGVRPDSFDSAARGKLSGYMNQISMAIEDLNTEGVTGIKNPQSLAQVNSLIAEITAASNLVIQIINR